MVETVFAGIVLNKCVGKVGRHVTFVVMDVLRGIKVEWAGTRRCSEVIAWWGRRNWTALIH